MRPNQLTHDLSLDFCRSFRDFCIEWHTENGPEWPISLRKMSYLECQVNKVLRSDRVYYVETSDVGKTSRNHPRFEPLGRVLESDIGKMIVRKKSKYSTEELYYVENTEQFLARTKPSLNKEDTPKRTGFNPVTIQIPKPKE